MCPHVPPCAPMRPCNVRAAAPPPAAHPLPGLTKYGVDGWSANGHGHHHHHGHSASLGEEEEEEGGEEQSEPGDHDAGSSVFSGAGPTQQHAFPPPLPTFPSFMHHALVRARRLNGRVAA